MMINLSYYAKNQVKLRIGNITLFFSYRTIIAYCENDTLFISENIWSKTTGKHLNAINPDKKIRLNPTTFSQLLNNSLSRYNEKEEVISLNQVLKEGK